MLEKYENCLSEYFLFESMLGNLANKDVFNAVADVSMLGKKEAEALYALTLNEEVAEIRTLEDYNRYLRVNEYLGVSNLDDEHQLIAAKGQALSYAAKFELIAKEGMTALTIKKNLMNNALSGKIAAMRCLGVLQCVGLIFDKNEQIGRAHV